MEDIFIEDGSPYVKETIPTDDVSYFRSIQVSGEYCADKFTLSRKQRCRTWNIRVFDRVVKFSRYIPVPEVTLDNCLDRISRGHPMVNYVWSELKSDAAALSKIRTDVCGYVGSHLLLPKVPLARNDTSIDFIGLVDSLADVLHSLRSAGGCCDRSNHVGALLVGRRPQSGRFGMQPARFRGQDSSEYNEGKGEGNRANRREGIDGFSIRGRPVANRNERIGEIIVYGAVMLLSLTALPISITMWLIKEQGSKSRNTDQGG